MRRRVILHRLGVCAAIGGTATLSGLLAVREDHDGDGTDAETVGDAGSDDDNDAGSDEGDTKKTVGSDGEIGEDGGDRLDDDGEGTRDEAVDTAAEAESRRARDRSVKDAIEIHAARCRCPLCGGGSMPGRP